jgi:hypothetical protein
MNIKLILFICERANIINLSLVHIFDLHADDKIESSMVVYLLDISDCKDDIQ